MWSPHAPPPQSAASKCRRLVRSRVSFETSYDSKQPKLEPKQTEDQQKQFDRDSVIRYFSKKLGLFRFVSKQFCLFRLFRYRFETPKQTEANRNKPKIFCFWFHKNYWNWSCFGLFRFEPNFFSFRGHLSSEERLVLGSTTARSDS